MVRVNFGGDDFSVASVGEAGPAIDAVPALTQAGAVVEDDLYCDRKDEVPFAVKVDRGEVQDLLLSLGSGSHHWTGLEEIPSTV